MPAKTKPQPVSTRSGPRRSISDQPKLEPNLARHSRKCAICNHPHREHIEDDFISWRSENTITLEYHLPSRSSIFRHAAATGLLARRRRNLRGVAERILGNVDQAPPSASAVLRALRIFTQITEDGQWVEPAKRSIVTHIHVTKHESPPPSNCHSACPEERREPSALPLRHGGEACPPRRESALHVAEAAARVPSEVHSDLFVGAPSTECGMCDTAPPLPESDENSADAPPCDSSGEITVNTRWNKRLPWHPGPEILSGHQNASPETSTNRKYAP